MAKVKVKLNKGVAHFYDLASRTSLFPGEEKALEFSNPRVKAAIASGILIKVPLNKTEEEAFDSETTAEKNPLFKLTRKEIMEKYGFLDEEDTAIAESKKTKAELIQFLTSVEKNYE